MLGLRMMKIAVLVEYLPPRLGSDRRIFEIMKRLSGKHEIHFIIFPPFRELRNKPKQNNERPPSDFRNKDLTTCEGINGHTLSISRKIALLWQHSLVIGYCLTAMSLFLKSTKLLRKIDPDIIVLNYPSPHTGLLGLLTGKLWHKPVILDFDDLIAQYTAALLNINKNSFKAKLLTLVQDYIAKNSHEIVAPTHFIKNYTLALGVPTEKISVIPNGADTKIFTSNNSNTLKLRSKLNLKNERLCAYCGRLDGWAGINIISKLCDIAQTRKLNVKFLLVGSGDGKTAQNRNVITLGEKPYEEVPAILSASDIILIPFPNNEISHAASPLKLFEGMAMQKPIIASKVSGIEEVVSDGENGFLADPDNLEEWVQKLETILSSETLAANMGQDAKRTVEEKYDWAFLAKQYEEVLNTVYPKQQPS
jgi:glycosyltransferase involved in cell wall biosynthesis